MTPEVVVIGSGVSMRRLIQRLMALTFERPWKVTIERVSGKRTAEDNAVIRGMSRAIAEFTGEDAERMHEILLARRFGVEEVPLGEGKVMQRPAKRVSDLTHDQALEYMRWLEAFAATELALDIRR